MGLGRGFQYSSSPRSNCLRKETPCFRLVRNYQQQAERLEGCTVLCVSRVSYRAKPLQGDLQKPEPKTLSTSSGCWDKHQEEFAQLPCARSARIPLILFPAHSERVIQPYFTTAAGITGGVQLSTSCRPPEIALGALSSQGICLRGENTNKFPQFPTPGPPGIALGIHPPT